MGGVLALVVAGGAVALLSGGDDGILGDLPIPGVDEGPETPDFAFEVRRVVPQTTTETPGSKVKKDAADAGDDVKATLDALYVGGFVEPDSWGDFGAIEELFDKEALDRAEADLDTLTLGETAGDTYSFVQPDKGVLVIDVLTDQGDKPVQALASALFVATAEADDGTFTKVMSTGSYFLHRIDGDWKIYAYEVERSDKRTEAPGSESASTSGSPTDEATP